MGDFDFLIFWIDRRIISFGYIVGTVLKRQIKTITLCERPKLKMSKMRNLYDIAYRGCSKKYSHYVC